MGDRTANITFTEMDVRDPVQQLQKQIVVHVQVNCNITSDNQMFVDNEKGHIFGYELCK